MRPETTIAKIVTRPSLTETLKALPISEPTVIKSKQFKQNSVRNAISKLNRKGFAFDASEQNQVDQITVTRTK